ncbi:MAG: hypothetical protein H6834_17550 [Planctomycetes bacterium]|nr:hypothetical protein [Planctomycetota bacterium]
MHLVRLSRTFSRTSPFLFLAAATCLAGSVRSQIKVVPSQYAAKEGGGNSEAPGDWTPVHMQCLYHKNGIQNGVGLVSAIAYRPDGTTNAYQAETRQIKIELATQNVPDPEFSSSIYEGNRGSDFREVHSSTLSLPALTGATGPRPFSVKIPFKAPFVYALATNVLVEITVTGSTFVSKGWKVDATPGLVLNPSGLATDVGSGCPTSFKITAQGLVPWPGALARFSAPTGMTQVAPFVLVIGSQALNIDLTNQGAPGCGLYQDLAIVLTGTTTTNGVAQLDFGKLPETPTLKGAFVPMQVFAFDPTFNTFGFRASAGYSMTLGQGFPVGLEAHAWYDRRDNTTTLFTQADFRSTRTPIFEFQ